MFWTQDTKFIHIHCGEVIKLHLLMKRSTYLCYLELFCREISLLPQVYLSGWTWSLSKTLGCNIIPHYLGVLLEESSCSSFGHWALWVVSHGTLIYPSPFSLLSAINYKMLQVYLVYTLPWRGQPEYRFYQAFLQGSLAPFIGERCQKSGCWWCSLPRGCHCCQGLSVERAMKHMWVCWPMWASQVAQC